MSIPQASVHIREVWANNLEEEFKVIREVVLKYPYIAMDTEFPGVIFSLKSEIWRVSREEYYNFVKNNVNALKIIQLGLTFFDQDGNLPISEGTDNKYSVWQFNFRDFDVEKDMYDKDSVAFLRKSGIDLDKNRQHGIDASEFAALLMSSGAVLTEDTQWVTYEGGQDCGYLLKMLTGKKLPDTLEEFSKQVDVFFGTTYDVKVMTLSCDIHGGLTKVTEQLQVDRVGTAHQAGSDSHATCLVFKKLKEGHLRETIEKFARTINRLRMPGDTLIEGKNKED